MEEDIRVNYEENRRYRRLKVPAAMDSTRVVHRYQEVVMAEHGIPVLGSGGENRVFRIADETVAFL